MICYEEDGQIMDRAVIMDVQGWCLSDRGRSFLLFYTLVLVLHRSVTVLLTLVRLSATMRTECNG